MRATFFLVSVLLIGGCSDSSDSDATPTPTPTSDATLSEIQTRIFTPSCTQSTCHDVSGAGGLELTSASISYAQLVDVPARQAGAATRGKIRVIPGDAANSFLLQKLDASLEADEGDVMPRNTSGLANARIKEIRDWINDGAPNN